MSQNNLDQVKIGARRTAERKIERLLNAEYFVYEHEESGDLNVACDAYSVPSFMRQHIDLLTPTDHSNRKLESRHVPRTRRSSGASALRP